MTNKTYATFTMLFQNYILVVFVSTLFNAGSIFDTSQSSKRPIICFFLLFSNLRFYFLLENLERASISLLMLSAKQRNHQYHFFNVFGMTRSLAGIEPWTYHTRSKHFITRLSRRYSMTACSPSLFLI